ncbi:MAG: TIGR03943 family protein [Anaerolineales bacterium]|nr:TIGR03943 family protein [Anaerolineales bacterium]
MTWYINSRFVPLTIIGILFLALLAQTLFSEIRRSRQHELEHPEHHHEHDHAPSSVTLWVMLIPLAIGLLIPARPLDSSAFSTKGFNTSAPLVSSDSSASIFETESQERNILQWLKLFNYQDDITEFIGQEASVVGFVYFDEDTLEADQFFVSRFVVSWSHSLFLRPSRQRSPQTWSRLSPSTMVILNQWMTAVYVTFRSNPMNRARSIL